MIDHDPYSEQRVFTSPPPPPPARLVLVRMPNGAWQYVPAGSAPAPERIAVKPI